MKKHFSQKLYMPLILWSAVCIGFYFFAAVKQLELIMHLYLAMTGIAGMVYLFLQSPAVEVIGSEEKERKRKAVLQLTPRHHRMLSQGILLFGLPFLFSFLADYLLILLDANGLFDYFI